MEFKKDHSGERLLINIVLEGGGAKGIAYVGMKEALEKQPTVDIASVAGASAGAITAMLIAANYKAAEILEHLPGALEHLGAQIPKDVSGWLSIIKQLKATGAALDNTQLRDWLGDRLAEKVDKDKDGNTVEDGTKVSFKDLFCKTQIELFVVAANVSKERLMVFHHKITPKCRVVDAVLASSAIPGALPVGKVAMVESRQHEPERVHTLVDGGVWANFPDFVFKDESFRKYWGLDAVKGKVVGFLLHETDKCIRDLSSKDYSREADLEEIRTSQKSAQFKDTKDLRKLNRTEAVLHEERTDPQKAGVFGLMVICSGFFAGLATLVAATFWEPARNLFLLVPVVFAAIVLFLLGILLNPPTRQSMASNDHGWPRNRITSLASLFLVYLATWPLMLLGWGVIFLGLGIAITQYRVVSIHVLPILMLAFIAFAILLLTNVVALSSLTILKKALEDWVWGVSHTFLASSGAPWWRGEAPDDFIVYLPIPKELKTLSFTVHKKPLPQSEPQSKTRVIDRIKYIAKEATKDQLEKQGIFPLKTTTDRSRD